MNKGKVSVIRLDAILALICVSFYLMPISLLAQSEVVRETVIDTIIINNRYIPDSEKSDIVLGTNDSITFIWSCHIQNAERSVLLFRTKLKTKDDSANHVYHITSFRYKNLKDNEYQFFVQAFDPGGNWLAKPAMIGFRVNTKEAELKKQLDSLNAEMEKKKSANAKEQESALDFGFLEIFIYSLVVLLGASVSILLVIILKNKKKNNQKQITEDKPIKINKIAKDFEMDTGKISISKEEYEHLIAENNNLHGEIQTLRNQIDALQLRSQELGNQNKDLQDSVRRLSSSKEELEELQKQKDELFAMIIHDIKNPASLIKSLVELLRSYDLTATEQQDVINDIVETTSKIVSLSQEVSRILALEGSRLILDLETLPINEVVSDVVKTNQIAAANKQIRLIIEVAPELPEISADPQKLAEIVDNLISNAIKFTHKGGTVQVKTRQQEDLVVVDVMDNGLGLSENDIKNAFQRGARLSAKPTEGEPSSGLGLWIVKKLVEAHKGRVWVRSSLGKGSTFSVALPAVNKMAEA